MAHLIEAGQRFGENSMLYFNQLISNKSSLFRRILNVSQYLVNAPTADEFNLIEI